MRPLVRKYVSAYWLQAFIGLLAAALLMALGVRQTTRDGLPEPCRGKSWSSGHRCDGARRSIRKATRLVTRLPLSGAADASAAKDVHRHFARPNAV